MTRPSPIVLRLPWRCNWMSDLSSILTATIHMISCDTLLHHLLAIGLCLAPWALLGSALHPLLQAYTMSIECFITLSYYWTSMHNLDKLSHVAHACCIPKSFYHPILSIPEDHTITFIARVKLPSNNNKVIENTTCRTTVHQLYHERAPR